MHFPDLCRLSLTSWMIIQSENILTAAIGNARLKVTSRNGPHTLSVVACDKSSGSRTEHDA